MIFGVLQMSLLNIWPDGKRVRLCATPGEVKKDNSWYRETLTELLTMLSTREVHRLLERVYRSYRYNAHIALFKKAVLAGKLFC